MYKRDEETIDHLLMHCPVPRELWNLVFSLFGILWVMPMGLWILQQAGQVSLTDRYAAIWAMIPHCLMWRIWWERNSCTFEGSKRLIHDLKLLFFQTLSERTNAGFFPFNSLADLLDSYNFLAL